MGVERRASRRRRQTEGKDGLEGHEFSSDGKGIFLCLTKPSQAGICCILYS